MRDALHKINFQKTKRHAKPPMGIVSAKKVKIDLQRGNLHGRATHSRLRSAFTATDSSTRSLLYARQVFARLWPRRRAFLLEHHIKKNKTDKRIKLRCENDRRCGTVGPPAFPPSPHGKRSAKKKKTRMFVSAVLLAVGTVAKKGCSLDSLQNYTPYGCDVLIGMQPKKKNRKPVRGCPK